MNGKLFIPSHRSGVGIFGMQVIILIAWRVVFWRTEVRKSEPTPKVIRTEQFIIRVWLFLMAQ